MQKCDACGNFDNCTSQAMLTQGEWLTVCDECADEILADMLARVGYDPE